MTFINVSLTVTGTHSRSTSINSSVIRVFRFREAFRGSFADLHSIPANPHRFQFSLQGMIDLFNGERGQTNIFSRERERERERDIDRSLER